ncbi:MAG: signal transduction histidine kinase [Paraglaciecola sp.]|jgi:signal transduction histidine kinase
MDPLMSNMKNTLSRKLLTRVLSVYFVLTLIVTTGQVFTEYLNAKSHIEGELQTLKNTFSTSLTRAIWELNMAQAESIATGLMELPIVEGVQIRDENGHYISNLGRTTEQPSTPITKGIIQDHDGGTFGYGFPLIFEFSGRTSLVGDVTLYSSIQIIFSRIEVGIFFLIGNAIIKTAFLVFLFMSAFRTMLTHPLNELRQQITDFNIDDPESSKLHLQVEDDNEFKLLENSYNSLVDGMIDFQSRLKGAQNELQNANRLLDDQNISLEQEVAKKTATLSRIMLDLEQQKDELIVNQRELHQENENRQFIEDELRKRNFELASSMETLQQTKDQLVESERMASLGGLVAEIAHDVNTPLGIGVTATSFLQERVNNLRKSHEEKTLTGSTMSSFLSEAQQSISLLINNLNRASNLISSFKQVAVDQASEAKREINLKEYLHEIIQSLAPSLQKSQHVINISCPDDIIVNCAPGILAQIFTNMVMNSLIHGFEYVSKGTIYLNISENDGLLTLDYQDNGKGIPADSLAKHFDALHTTKRGRGGSGLGTHVMCNLVTQTLKGDIEVFSQPGKGLHYIITVPVNS